MSDIRLKNKKQELFCIEYAKSLNATQSALKAGYSEKTAYSHGARLLKNVEIQNRISEIAKPEENKAIASAEEVLEFLSNTMRGITPDLDTDTGEPLNVPIKDKLKAAELLGKRHALFTEKVEHSGDINNPFEKLTTEELRKLASKDS